MKVSCGPELRQCQGNAAKRGFYFFLKTWNFNNNNQKKNIIFFKKMKALWISFAPCWISVSLRKCAHQNEFPHFPALCLSIQHFTSSLKPGPPLRSIGFTHFWMNTSQTWIRLWIHGPGWGPKGSLPTSSPVTLCCLLVPGPQPLGW